MSFILKTDTLFKKQTEDPLKLVQAVSNSSEFRMNSLFSAIDKKVWRLGEDEKEHYLLETTEGVLPRTMAVTGATVGQFVSIPVLMNVLLTEKNDHIQKLEKELQELVESHNSLLQQLEESKGHQKTLLEDIKEEPPDSLELPKEETIRPILMEGNGEDAALKQAKTSPLDSKNVPNLSSELPEEENIRSFLIEKDAEIISLKHEVAALQEELHEKEALLKKALKKLENLHELLVKSQEGTKQFSFSQETGLLTAEKDKLESSLNMGKSKYLLSSAVAEADEIQAIVACKLPENQIAALEDNGTFSEVKSDDHKEKNIVLEALLDSLRRQIYTEEQHSDSTSKSDTSIAAAIKQQELEEEKGVLEDAPSTLIQKRKLKKEKMYLEKLCSLLIQERLQRKYLIEPYTAKIPEMHGPTTKDSSKVFSHTDEDITSSGESSSKMIKLERDEASIEGFLISLILKDLERVLDSKENQGDVREEEDAHKLKAEQHMGQVETLIPNGSATSVKLKEKKEEFEVLMAEEINPENSLTPVPPNDMQQKNPTVKSEAEKEENVVKQEQDIIKMHELDIHMGDRETLGDGKDAISEVKKMIDDPLLVLQRELETSKKERDVLLHRLEDYGLEPTSSLEITTPKSFSQIQETSPALLRELQILRQERDSLQANLRSQVLKENNLLLEYDVLKNEYENLKITLHKTIIERDNLELKLNEYPWKEKELDRMRYHAKESEILRIERDRMKIKLEELAGIEVAYIKLIEKTEKLEMKLKEADNLKEKGQGEVKIVHPKTCERESQVPDTEDSTEAMITVTHKRAPLLPNPMIMENITGRMTTETGERASHMPSFMLMEDIAEAMNMGVCKAHAYLMREQATQTSASDMETRKKLVTTEQDNTRLEEQAKMLEKHVHKIAVLRSERHQVHSELNQLREEINKQFCVVNDLKELKHKLEEAQQLKQNASEKVLQDIRLQLTKFKQENFSLRDEIEKLRNTQLQLKSQLKNEEKLVKQARTLDDERRRLQKEFKQLQDIAKESFRTNQRLKQCGNIEHLQLSDMCEELQNFNFIFKQLLSDNSAMGDTIGILKETEKQLKNLTTQMDEEILSLGKKLVELEEENASLKHMLFEGQESLRRQTHKCDKEISEIKRKISEFSHMGILLKRYKNKLFQLNQENVSLKYKILTLKEALSLKAASPLSEEVKSLNFELNLLHKENATLSERILELSQENSLQSSMPSNEIKCLKHQVEKLMKENISLQQNILFLEKENNILKQSYLSPDEAPSFTINTNQTNEENIDVDSALEEQRKEMSREKDTAPIDSMQTLKYQLNQLIQENQELKEKLKNKETQENYAQNLMNENNSLQYKVVDKAENSALLPSAHETESVTSHVLKSHIIELQKALQRKEEICKYLENEFAEISNKNPSEEVTLLKTQLRELQDKLVRQEEKYKYLENQFAETSGKNLSEEISHLKNQLAELQEELAGKEEKCIYLENELIETSNKHSSEEIVLLKNHIVQLEETLGKQKEKCKYLEIELAETSNKHSSEEIVFLKNHTLQLEEALEKQEEKCKYLENELAETSNKHSSEEIFLKNHIVQLQKELERQDEKCRYLENELAETSNKHSSEEIFLKNHIVQLQKELERQDEKCRYLENELADTSNKLIECEVKKKLNTEATTDGNNISNHTFQNIKKELLDEQRARELAEEILQYTQYELDKEKILTKELQGQVSMLEEQIAVEKQLRQLSGSINTRPLPKDFTETSEISAAELASEMYKLEEDKVNLEEAIKCNKVLITENLYLKQCLQECRHLKEHTTENNIKDLENLKAENLELLNKIKSCENKISMYDLELHKLYSETERLKEEVKIRRSAAKIMEMGLEIKQKLEKTINENNEATVGYKDVQADFEELKTQISEIRDLFPQGKLEWFRNTRGSEDAEMISHEHEVNTSQETQEKVKEIQQLESERQGEERLQLSALIQSFQVAIHELGTKLSETAENFQVIELKDLEYATSKLETEVKALREQMFNGDTVTMSLLTTCISEKQELKGYFQNLMNELKTIKEYSCGIDIIKANLQQKIEENIQLENTVQKMKSEIEALRQLNFKNEDKTLSTLQEVRYVVDCMRRKCQICSEAYDHCTNLLKGFSLEELLITDSNGVDWRNKYTNLEHELQEVRNKLSDCEKKLLKVSSEKEKQKLKALSLEKELKYLQHEHDISGDTPAATETLKHTTRLKVTLSKSKELHNLKQTNSNGDSKDTEKIQEVIQLIERMRRKCRRCAAAYDHCANLLNQVIAKNAPSSNDAELMTLQEKYEELLNEFKTKMSVEEELIEERSRVLCLQKEIEHMKKNLEEYKIQEHITIDNILDEERKRTEELERELSEWKKKYEESWDLINTQTLRNTKAKTTSPRIKAMKAEITQLKKQLKTLQKEVSNDMLNAEREKNLNLQKQLENLRKESEQYKIQEQYYIEDILNAEVQKTVALEQEVKEWKCKYEDCWKLMNTQTTSTTEPMSTKAHVQAMESEIADLKEKLSIYKVERNLLDPELSINKMANSETENIKALEEELEKLRDRNKKLHETVEEMETKHQYEVKELRNKIGELEMKLASMSGQQNSDYEEGNMNVRLQFQKQLREKESMYEANIKNLKASFQRDIKNLKKLHDESILRLQKQHDEELQEVNRMHEDELKVISAPAEDENIVQHLPVNLTLDVPQNQQQATDYTAKCAGDSSAETILKDSVTIHSSPSRSFTNILTKALQDGVKALNFSELSRLHQEVCQATSAFVLDGKDVSQEEMLKSSQESLDKGQLSKCISALQMEVIKRQKEAEKKVLYFGMQICKERKRICELREHLRHEKEENLDLRNCISVQSQSIATLNMEKALMQRQSECIKQRLQQYIILLKKERAKARLLEEEVSKVKSTKKKLENLLEMEKKYNETNESRQALFIEAMKIKLDTAIESEAKLRYQLHQKQGCQMAGDAGMAQRDVLEDNTNEL